MSSSFNELKDLLDHKVNQFNRVSFIEVDPISIPHQFSRQQDIEIAAFFTAIISWGQRKSILKSAQNLMNLMDGEPYHFIKDHMPSDRKRFERFVHRTFNATDLMYLIEVLSLHFQHSKTMEDLFIPESADVNTDAKSRLIHFHQTTFKGPFISERTRKHIATPERNSACKRLNMFLRWMVRQDANGVDFGIWKRISPAVLMCPLDVHVHRVALNLNLMQRTQSDWKAVEELTQKLRQFDPEDPVKYDFALFGIGLEEKYHQ